MYEKIRSRKSVPELYEDKLIVRFGLLYEADSRPARS